MSQEAVNPRAIISWALTAASPWEKLSADGELALSTKNLNLLSSSGTQEAGKAGKTKDRFQFWGPFGITGRAKKVGSQFQALADPDPQTGRVGVRRQLKFFGGSRSSARRVLTTTIKYTSGGPYENLYKNAKAQGHSRRAAVPAVRYL